ncbi:MAG: YfhO family protein, partial [Acidobacteriota bacterium]
LSAYALPLFSGNASIQWDAVDVHYSAQRYFAGKILHGELPHWTPYLFAGFPFLADPQTGAWYPGNWPFFLLGPSPQALEANLALHALLAAAGLFLLLKRWTKDGPATAGALTYALGGFFAGHSSHLGIFQAAALFPWLILSLFIAAETHFWRGVLLGTLTGGAIALAGHFQTALYSFSALALLTIAISKRKAFAFLLLAGVGSALLSAVQTLPGLELAAQSIRASANFSSSPEGLLQAPALLTLVLPDSLGATSQTYHGPGDQTQYYFYSGFLLLPLAALGLRKSPQLKYALCLILPAVLYLSTPWLTALPIFRSVRAPIHAWFIVSFALSLLAAAGLQWLDSKWRFAAVAAVIVLALDLCVTNMWTNPLAYAHASFQSLYGQPLDKARDQLRAATPARIDEPANSTAWGPLNHALDLRVESANGYNPLTLARFSGFRQAFASNPKLRESLSITHAVDTAGAIQVVPNALPRAYFPREILSVPNDDAARRALATLDPPSQTILVAHAPIQQDPQATVAIQKLEEQSYQLTYQAATPSVLRLAVPYFPGWRATVNGASAEVFPADYAMTGILVPAGNNQLEFRFHSTYFLTGAALTATAILILLGLATLSLKGDSPHETHRTSPLARRPQSR